MNILIDRFDGLMLYYGNDTTNGIMKFYDGTSHNGTVIESYGNQLLLQFRSNYQNQFKGFSLTYRSGKVKEKMIE